jgi:hypothetical protein
MCNVAHIKGNFSLIHGAHLLLTYPDQCYHSFVLSFGITHCNFFPAKSNGDVKEFSCLPFLDNSSPEAERKFSTKKIIKALDVKII